MHPTPIVPESALRAIEQTEPLTLRGVLLDAYNGSCAITGCAVAEALQVALIDPAMPGEPANLLLLRADLGHLFAAGLLAVDALSLTVVLAPALEASPYAELAGVQLRQPQRVSHRPSRQALDAHHRRFAGRHQPAAERALAPEAPATPEALPSPPVPASSAETSLAPASLRLAVTRVIQVKSLVNSVAYSRDGALAATGSWDGVARVWRVNDGYLLHSLRSELGEINGLALSPDGQVLAAVGRNQAAQLWRLADGAALPALGTDGHHGAVFGVAFAPNSTMVASGSWDRSVRVWQLGASRPRLVLEEHRGAVNSVAFSPNGKLLASASHDRLVRLWQVGDGTLRNTLHGHSDAVFSVAFSPNGRLLASAGTDQTIRLWRVADGALVYSLSVQGGAIFSVVFSPDGRLLASGDYGRAVRIWRVADGAPLHVAAGHAEGVTSLAFSPNGRNLLSGSFDATVRFWELSG